MSDQYAIDLIEKTNTIGEYLKLLNREIRANMKNIETLTRKESCKMWILVLAGNEPSKDVATLTKGALSSADVNRLMVATEANIVKDLKQYPQQIGIIANYFDC